MANAAAKKASAAREAAASMYLPVFLCLNAIHLLLRMKSSFSGFHGAMTCVLGFLSYFSYKGILEDHANRGSATATGGQSKPEPLAGGASLDLFGLTLAVQFGSVLVSDYFYWLLILIPFGGVWKMYTTFNGLKNGVGEAPEPQMGSMDEYNKNASLDKAAEKRQKRAERRRQKWS